MFRIRPEQLEALEPRDEDSVAERIMEHLKREHRHLARCLTYDRLFAIVQSGMARAARYDLGGLQGQTAFVAIMLEVAPNFDEHPSIQAVLQNPELDPETRMDVLLERTSDEDWQEAYESYDVAGWFSHLVEGDEEENRGETEGAD